ncbi:SCP-like protein [Ancylostoma duodenale]|uniref:SCP-like protein n=1 Tax=Ancylostoma duodenale TaxID=51022 RepID=A0A0C2CPA3_9BILA|nr:SCP-like protein [Ancylostoma duodenale]
MTDEMKKTAENMHNYYRRLIATGWAEDPRSKYAPRASKMNYLTFDCDNLAVPMKTAINKCQVPADAPGQNVHVTTWDISRQAALEEAITTWYGGLEKGGGIGEDTTYTTEMESNKMLTQYATVRLLVFTILVSICVKAPLQLAYEGSTKVGCAVKTCQAQGNTIVACKYNGQPVEGDPIYTVGKPCSGCSANTNNKKCEADSLKALCVA